MKASDISDALGNVPEDIIGECLGKIQFQKAAPSASRNTNAAPKKNHMQHSQKKIKRIANKPENAPIRISSFASGIAVAACLLFAAGFGAVMYYGSRDMQQPESSTQGQLMQPAAEITVPIEAVETETIVTEATAPEPVYAELELHNPEKRVISWEEQDALMENARAKYQEEGGFPIINTKPYVDKFTEPWGDQEAYDTHFAELNELEYKSYIYHMMLNSIDYFSSAEGRMTYGLNDGKMIIHFQK